MAHSSEKQHRLRILMAAYQIRNLSNGGMESATRIFEALAQRFDWTLLTTRETDRTTRWRNNGASVMVNKFDETGPRWKRRIQGIIWAIKFAYQLLRFRPHVTHCNDIQSYKAYSFLPKLLKKAPLVFTLRNMRPENETFGPIWIKLADEAKKIIVLSDEMGEKLARRLPGAGPKLQVINSLVGDNTLKDDDNHCRSALRRDLGISEGEFAIGCIGAIREKKGQIGLLEEVTPMVSRALPRAKIYFLGDADPEGDSFCQQFLDVAASSNYPDSFVVKGHIDDLQRWYAALDLVVIASETEGLSRAMIEAMASGVPVVSTAVCSAREMLDLTGAGRVVEVGDFTALGEAIMAFASGDRRITAGAIGKTVAAAKFSPLAVTRSWDSLYTEIGSSSR